MPRKATSQVSLLLQVRPRKRWASPDVPEFDPNWIAEFRFPGRRPIRESTHLPVCEDCLADRRRGKSLAESCGCRMEARRCAEVRFKSLQAGWLTEKMEVQQWSRKHAEFSLPAVLNLFRETLVHARAPGAEGDLLPFLHAADAALAPLLREWMGGRVPVALGRLPLRPVWDLYERGSVESKDEVLGAVRQVYEAATGRPVTGAFVDEFNAGLLRAFAALYQEYGRRGWSVRGAAPADAWVQLRALRPAPAIDWETPAPWNTTIKSLLGRVKSLFGRESRQRHLFELANQLPDMRGLEECALPLPTPDNRKALSAAQAAVLAEKLPLLKETDPRAWLMLRMVMIMGTRSIEAKAVRRGWIERDGATGEVLLVKRQRLDFALKDRASKVVYELPFHEEDADVLEMIATVRDPERSIYDLDNEGQVDAVYRRASLWMKEAGVVDKDSTQTLYLLRKTRITAAARAHGMGAAQTQGGHAAQATTEGYYVEPTKRGIAMSQAEVSATLSRALEPWVPGVPGVKA